MKHPISKFLAVMVILASLLSACGAPAAPTAEPTKAPAASTSALEPTKTSQPAATKAPETPKGAVTSLDDVKSATIQIQAEGTFIDPQVGMVVNSAGRGSGFLIDPSGIAVTNNHVVTGAALLKVWVGGNKDKVYNARVLGVSECSDLAVIKIDGSAFPYLQWRDGDPKVGLEVYAAGFPLGDPEFTLTKGIVSKAKADGRTNWASIESVIEHDARINPGNSGGPLVDKDGKLVGVNYASNQANQYFAISRTEVDASLSELKAGNDVTSIGVNGQVVVSQELGISGVWVSSVKSGSPADKAAVKAGDIIVQMEGLVLGTDGTKASYCQILRSHKASDTLTIKVLRWSSKQILEGQLNGRVLAVTGTFGGSSSQQQPTAKPSGPVVVTDDAKVIGMLVPQGWQYDGSAWKNTWLIGNKNYPFTAQTLTASPNVKAFKDGWSVKGIIVATSRDWASIGGYANLLEGMTSYFAECQPKGTQAYKDGTYEGQMVVYTKCGPPQTNSLILSVRPISNPTAYLVMVIMKFANDAELDELDVMLQNTEVNP